MSEIYFCGVGSQSNKIVVPDIVENDSGQHSNNWVPRSETIWNPVLGDAMLNFFTKLSYPFRDYLSIPFKDPLRSEIRRFLLSLDAYIDSPNPVIPYRDILYGATQKDFATRLKRIKTKSLLTTWYAVPFAIPDWWEDVPAYRITDIGDIFNYSYLPFFAEEVDDYLYGLEPVKVNKQTLSDFKDILEELLPSRESFNVIDKLEILSSISSSISRERSSGKRKPHYLIKDKYLTFSKKRHTCTRCVIPVSPANIRDSVLCDPGDLNTISLIDQQVLEMLRVMPDHIHLTDKEKVTKRCNKLLKKYTVFLHRDMQKEGITKPRELLKATLEVLHSKYPDVPAFEYTDFYDEYTLEVNGEHINLPRGHGLGMANALTTLIQIAISQLIIDRSQVHKHDLEGDTLSLNDDFVAGFHTLEDLETYWDEEDLVFDELSIKRSPQKSFHVRNRFVLAERYFTHSGEFEKTSYQLRELLLPLACANIVHAKEYFSAAQTYTNPKFVGKYIGEIASYWGYEFYPKEFNYPTIVGGWINEKINSVDMALVMLEQLDYKSYVNRGYKAARTQLGRPDRGDIYTPPLITLLGNPLVPKQYWDKLNILSETELNHRFGKILSRSPDLFNKYWNNLLKKRQKVFKQDFDVPFTTLLETIIKDNPTKQFYPCEHMIRCYHSGNTLTGQINDFYLDPNPKMALLSKLDLLSYPFKEEFSIEFVSRDNSTKKISSLFSKETQRTLKSEVLQSLMIGKFHEIYIPEDGYQPQEQYLNPVKIGEVTSIMNWGRGFPEIYTNFVSPLIEKKREVFNRLFSLEEQFMLSSSGLNRECIKEIASFMNKTGDSLSSILEYLGDNLAPKPKKVKKSQEDEIYEPEIRIGEDSGTVREDSTHIVRYSDLIGEDSSKYYLWQNNQKDYIPENEEVKNVLNKLNTFVLYATHPLLRTTEEKMRMKEDIIANVYGHEFHYIAKNVGILNLFESSLMLDDEVEEYDLDDIFGG